MRAFTRKYSVVSVSYLTWLKIHIKSSNMTNQNYLEPEEVAHMTADPLKLSDTPDWNDAAESKFHVLKPGVICDTDSRGHAMPEGRSPNEIVLNASDGFIALWDSDTTLRWRFQERSILLFKDPVAAANEIRQLFGEALLQWGAACPVKFTEDNDLWDFEIVVRPQNDCTPGGCVLASAFFPDTGRHEFVIYPKMFSQSRKEQVDIFIHETGHIFGLRHFFANISEQNWPVEIFGNHEKFSIMNYGELSELTDDDKSDLIQLYQQARSLTLKHINGTPIRLVRPYSTLAPVHSGAFAMQMTATTAVK
jgi:hypothetical protein